MPMKKYVLAISSLFIVTMFACVPARQFEDLQKKEKDCQDENAKLKAANQELTNTNLDATGKLKSLTEANAKLSTDTTDQGRNYRRLTDLYNELTKSYDKLIANNDKLMSGSADEQRKLIAQLNETKESLQKKEDALKKLEGDLNGKEASLDEAKKNLKDREAKVLELQSILDKKDSAVTALKNSVSNALLGYQNNGLTVEQKNGKVYVSLEERLLFASGSTVVEKKGEDALRQLATVLEKNADINVLVEGHTDDVPINGTLASGARDNWELSVLRATSVTKILLKSSGIDPKRITAAGRGPYLPLDTTSGVEAKKKNRRTEIILTPKLDELMKILDSK